MRNQKRLSRDKNDENILTEREKKHQMNEERPLITEKSEQNNRLNTVYMKRGKTERENQIKLETNEEASGDHKQREQR